MRTSAEHLQRTAEAIERFAHGHEEYDDRCLVQEAAEHGLAVARVAKEQVAEQAPTYYPNPHLHGRDT